MARADPLRDRDFSEFYAATNRQATAQVFAMVGNWHEAQEAVQEAYARALGKWDKVSTYDEPLAWIRTVAYRISVSRWRKARRLVFGGLGLGCWDRGAGHGRGRRRRLRHGWLRCGPFGLRLGRGLAGLQRRSLLGPDLGRLICMGGQRRRLGGGPGGVGHRARGRRR